MNGCSVRQWRAYMRMLGHHCLAKMLQKTMLPGPPALVSLSMTRVSSPAGKGERLRTVALGK